jgi:hypothetical protein
MAGAPVGNKNAAKAKVWSAAVKRALDKRTKAKGINALDALAEKLLSLCDDKDLGALKELGDRLEGKVAQSITGPDDGPIEIVARWLSAKS